MKILMVYPGPVDYLPPLLTSASSLAMAGVRVTVVAAGCSNSTRSYLSKCGVELITCHANGVAAGIVKRTFRLAAFLRVFRRTTADLAPDVVWYHGAHGMRLSWFSKATTPHLCVGHAHEMYAAGSFNERIQTAFQRKANLVIVPEINRAWIMKVGSRSSAQFVVIPNRMAVNALPASTPEATTRTAFLRAGGSQGCRKFVIYQGIIGDDRCLSTTLAAFHRLTKPEWGFIILGAGNDEASHKLRTSDYIDDPRIVFLPRIPPPRHLEITRGCRIGILLYAPSSLNNVYCAPNKVFEFASFGMGMILPNYPGIASLNAQFPIGELCNPWDEPSVSAALLRAMETRSDSYRVACQGFLDTTPEPDQAYLRVAELLGRLRSLQGHNGEISQEGCVAPVLDLSHF